MDEVNLCDQNTFTNSLRQVHQVLQLVAMTVLSLAAAIGAFVVYRRERDGRDD
jgi:hypothetical protein